MQHILVTGSTGTLGRLVVPRLRDAGFTVRVLSRRSRAAGAGIDTRALFIDPPRGIATLIGRLLPGHPLLALGHLVDHEQLMSRLHYGRCGQHEPLLLTHGAGNSSRV